MVSNFVMVACSVENCSVREVVSWVFPQAELRL